MGNAFKSCPMCGEKWLTQDDFILDPLLEQMGYQADFIKPDEGLFYFTHKKEACFTTLAVKAREFRNLYSGEIYSQLNKGEEDCRLYCTDINQLGRCGAACKCAYIREIIHIIKERKEAQIG